MAAQDVSLSTMFGWIPEAFRMMKSGKDRFIAASLWMLLVMILIMLPFLAMMFPAGMFSHAPGEPFQPGGGFWAAYGLLMLASLAVNPPLTAGWFRLCAAVDAGQPARGRDIFAPFRMPELWIRALVLMLLSMLIVAAIACVTMLPFLGSFMAFQRAAEVHRLASAAGAAGTPPMPPIGFFFGYFAFLLSVMLFQVVMMTAMAEVANRPTGALAALGVAARAVLKNLFKLILFGFCASTLAGVVMMVIIVPVVLLSVALAFISPIVSGVVVAVMYAALLLALYPLMFVFHYLMWRGMLGGAVPPPLPASVSV